MTFTAADIAFESNTRLPDGWRLLNDVELMDLPDPEFIVDGVLPRKGVCVLYGPSGAAKTTMVAGLTIAVATGTDWFGHRVCRRGASVYVATEDVSGFKVRLRAAKIAANLSLEHCIGVYTFPEPIDLRDPVSVNRFTRFVESTDVRMELVVVDTYAAATPGASENSSEDTTTAMAHAQTWRDQLNTSVLLVHHTNAGGSRERGHSSMRGAADLMISMTPVDDVVHVECSKQRNASPFAPITLKLTPVPQGGCVLRLASDVLPTAGLTPVQDKVLTVLRDTFAANGATKSEWRSACQDVAERSFHRAAKVLVERSFVRTAGTHFTLGSRS
ncbi:MAG: AAA family ATPase [Acidobacteriota bacterium]